MAREKLLGMVIVGEDLFKARSSQAIANAPRHFAKIQTLASGVGWPEQALQTAAQILRANQERLRGCVVGLNAANGGARGLLVEEIVRLSDIEGKSAIQVQHYFRILRGLGLQNPRGNDE